MTDGAGFDVDRDQHTDGRRHGGDDGGERDGDTGENDSLAHSGRTVLETPGPRHDLDTVRVHIAICMYVCIYIYIYIYIYI